MQCVKVLHIKLAIAFFVEPEEAKAVLNMTMAAHPDSDLRLVSIGLGDAYKLCVRDRDEKQDFAMRLQTSSQLAPEALPKLKAMLAASGMSEGSWQLPVFLCDQMASSEMIPIT